MAAASPLVGFGDGHDRKVIDRAASRRLLALGGVFGPVAFIAAWAVAGARQTGYSTAEDPISRLAAVGASTRPLMTAGLLMYAAGLAGYAAAAADDDIDELGWWPAALVCAAATAGVAATPLEGDLGGLPHAATAITGYASLAAIPATAAVRLRRAGRSGLSRVATVTAAASAACLTVSVAMDPVTGAWQRAGLTIGDAWLIATGAFAALRRR